MKISIRQITEKDVCYLYDSLFDKNIRGFSLNQQKVSYESHCEYWKKRLSNNQNKDYIIVCDGSRNVGCVRIDPDGQISIAVDKEFQGKGFGSIALDLAIKESKLKEYSSKILSKNTTSKKLFKKLGFKKQYEVYTLSKINST